MMDEGRVSSVEANAEPRWGLLMPLLTAGFCPAKTARRTDPLSGMDAIFIHLMGFVLLAVAVMSMLLWRDGRMAELFGLEVKNFDRLLIGVAVCDFAYIALGFFLAPWGAGRERLRTSLGRSIRRTLRHTPHAAQAFIMASSLAMPFFLANAHYWETFHADVRSTHNTLVEQGMNPDAYAVWERAREMVRARQPFYRKYGFELGAGFYFVGGLWFICGWLAAIGAAPLSEEDEEHPPICEACGYILTGLPVEGRCPECGVPILESLGPDARPGSPWQQRTLYGRFGGFWRTTVAALLAPTAVGRQLITRPTVRDHRSLVWVWAALTFVLTGLGGVAFHDELVPKYQSYWIGQWLSLGSPIASYCLALAGVLVCLSMAGVAGLLSSWRHGRNLLPAAMQAAGALGGFLLVWMVLAFTGGLLFWAESVYLLDHGWLPSRAWYYSVPLLITAPNVACALVYLWLIARMVRGARYANQ